jgi:hypothetical protein
MLVAVAALSAASQTRETPVQTPSGTGVISGVLVDAQSTPRPVRRAILLLTGAELPAGRAAISDEQGRFSFERLPAGQFTLSASKPAYLNMSYGAVRPGGAGTPIVLTAGQQITDVRMTLPHGGAIGGTIRDARGAPIAGIQVTVARPADIAVSSTARPESVPTDDRGMYRMFGLMPGSYIVWVAPSASGGIGEIGQMTSSEIDATFARLRARNPAAPSKPEPSPSSVVRPVKPFSIAPSYYPGGPDASAAELINLGLGEERNDIDFVYDLARSASVSGTYSGVGPETKVTVTLQQDGLYQGGPFGLGTSPLVQRSPDPNGFVFTNVMPGKYTLMARTGGEALFGQRSGGPPPTENLPLTFATMTLDVRGEDIGGISLLMRPAARVSGKLTFDQPSTTPVPADLTRIRLRLTSTVLDATPRLALTGSPMLAASAAVNADGTFTFNGVIPGAYRISTLGEPVGWRAKSAALDNRDIIDQPLVVGTSDVAGVEMAMTDRRSQVSGRLLLTSGAPASGYFVVAFPADPALWIAPSRRMKSARPSTDGQFRFDDLPAGDYFLAALTDADQNDWQAPAFLTQVMAAGVKLTLSTGETKTQDLKISK